MNEVIKLSKTMDLTNLACPMPVIKLSVGIRGVDIGDIIEVHATDLNTLTDIPAWCRNPGNDILDIKREGEIIRFLIRRTS